MFEFKKSNLNKNFLEMHYKTNLFNNVVIFHKRDIKTFQKSLNSFISDISKEIVLDLEYKDNYVVGIEYGKKVAAEQVYPIIEFNTSEYHKIVFPKNVKISALFATGFMDVLKPLIDKSEDFFHYIRIEADDDVIQKLKSYI